ncbi:hypothetical protein BLNAU_12112 [Blattamonas nauphoetae]|uniref:PB1 domain-containing protein n=1 Tax=Blattamonas nauphoetae TaxID=2049346 RepID=A0ABQ9XLL0_9EUKA|nr:hypothetical protein BLNAU_12112 [Blattamonas nauphoetae]
MISAIRKHYVELCVQFTDLRSVSLQQEDVATSISLLKTNLADSQRRSATQLLRIALNFPTGQGTNQVVGNFSFTISRAKSTRVKEIQDLTTRVLVEGGCEDLFTSAGERSSISAQIDSNNGPTTIKLQDIMSSYVQSLKISYTVTNDTRRMEMNQVPSMEALLGQIHTLFNIHPASPLSVTYTDSEGDTITIANDADVHTAFETAQLGSTINLSVSPKFQKASHHAMFCCRRRRVGSRFWTDPEHPFGFTRREFPFGMPFPLRITARFDKQAVQTQLESTFGAIKEFLTLIIVAMGLHLWFPFKYILNKTKPHEDQTSTAQKEGTQDDTSTPLQTDQASLCNSQYPPVPQPPLATAAEQDNAGTFQQFGANFMQFFQAMTKQAPSQTPPPVQVPDHQLLHSKDD